MFKKIQDIWANVNPLYIPLFTAIPVGTWLLIGNTYWGSTYLTLYILIILFLAFAGAVEISSEEAKYQVFGYIYMTFSLFLGIAGLIRWLT
ncbi:hypothetical protein [Halobacillus seohaensis]|uniref:Uncharacterized protein n=1 Tax=Halobacillus seohaensis TaxID=447421 RepID=A0ABW2EHT8_9BACI